MCRASNTARICFSEMSWCEDAYCVRFAWQKNDQAGHREKELRHCYANPLIPQVSIVLGLGLYLLCMSPDDRGAGHLFPDKKPYERFMSVLRCLVDRPGSSADYLRKAGIDSKNIGSYSLRKGAATYVSSGTTAPPSSVSVYLRGGWSLKSVQDRYLHEDACGDQLVGRIVSGLPVDSKDFALLPPFFVSMDNAFDQAFAENFSGFPPSLNTILRFCLASMVLHSEWLKQVLPVHHSVLLRPLFRNTKLLAHLRLNVHLRSSISTDVIKATGIPPAVVTWQKLDEIQKSIATIVTTHTLITSTQHVVPIDEPSSRLGSVAHDGVRLHRWSSGDWHILSETYLVPRGNALVALQHYLVGTEEAPPLLYVTGKDFAIETERRTFSHYKALMGILLHDFSAFCNVRWTISDVQSVYDKAKMRLLRPDHVAWKTQLEALRKQSRQRATFDEQNDVQESLQEDAAPTPRKLRRLI